MQWTNFISMFGSLSQFMPFQYSHLPTHCSATGFHISEQRLFRMVLWNFSIRVPTFENIWAIFWFLFRTRNYLWLNISRFHFHLPSSIEKMKILFLFLKLVSWSPVDKIILLFISSKVWILFRCYVCLWRKLKLFAIVNT